MAVVVVGEGRLFDWKRRFEYNKIDVEGLLKEISLISSKFGER